MAMVLEPREHFRDYAWPLTPEESDDVTKLVSDQLADEFIRDVYGIEEEVAGLREVSGRQQLAFYESQDITYWQNLLAVYPDTARQAFLEFARLVRRFEG